jgi:hypothetical protein
MAFEPLSYEDLVELWRLLFPGSYTFPIENEFNGQGFDVFSQQARIFAEAAEAVAVTQQVYYKLPHSTQVRPQAMGGQKASGTVNITRTSPTLGEISLEPGTLLEATVQGTRGEPVRIGTFKLTQFAILTPGDPGPVTVTAEALRVGYQGNVAPDSITSFVELGTADVETSVAAGNLLTDTGIGDRFTEQMLNRYVVFTAGPNVGTPPRKIIAAAPVGQVTVDGPALIQGPNQQVQVVEFDSLGLSVEQPDAFTGGRHAWLDAIGAERGIYRQDGETDEQFVLRICFLADTITPGAIERLCARILAPCGICCEITERGSTSDAMIWDLPTSLAPQIMSPWDEPGTVWDSLATQNRFLDIRVSCGNTGEIGFAYDAQPFAPVDDNAWDWPDLGPQLSPPVWDGFPAGYNACIAAYADALNNALAAGISYQITKDCTLDCVCEPAP